MGFETARVALVTKCEALRAAWAGGYTLLVSYDNAEKVDTSNLANPYLKVCLEYADGFQVDLAANPRHRILGYIKLEAVDKEGAGISKSNTLLSYFYSALQMKDAYVPLRTRAAVPMGSKRANGLVTTTVAIPFWYDDIT